MKGQVNWMPLDILHNPALLEDFFSKAAQEMNVRTVSVRPDFLMGRFEVDIEGLESNLLEQVHQIFVKYQVPAEKRGVFILLAYREYLAWCDEKKLHLSSIEI